MFSEDVVGLVEEMGFQCYTCVEQLRKLEREG